MMPLRSVIWSSVLLLALGASGRAADTGAAPTAAAAAKPTKERPATAAEKKEVLGPTAPTKSTPIGPSTTLGLTTPNTEPSAETADVDVASETLFVTSVAFLHQSFIGIGMLAETAGSGAYDGQAAADLLDTHHSLAEQVESQLRSLAAAPGLDDADREAIGELVRVAQLNKLQCEALAGFWEGDSVKEKTFETLREAAAKELDRYGEEEPVEPVAAQPGSSTRK